MSELLVLIFCTTTLVLGWTIATQENMVLFSVRLWAEQLKTKWKEPLFLCVWCQPSVWSIFGYLIAYATGLVIMDWQNIFMYPLVVCGSSFCGGFLWTIYLTLNAKKEYYSASQDYTIDIEQEN